MLIDGGREGGGGGEGVDDTLHLVEAEAEGLRREEDGRI